MRNEKYAMRLLVMVKSPKLLQSSAMDLWTRLWGRYHVPQNVFLVTTPSIWHNFSKALRPRIRLMKQSSYWKRRYQSDSILSTPWSSNSLDSSPVDYTVWSAMERKVYQYRIEDNGALHECIVSAWNEVTSEWLTRQSGSGELVFTTAPRWKLATLNTSCPAECRRGCQQCSNEYFVKNTNLPWLIQSLPAADDQEPAPCLFLTI